MELQSRNETRSTFFILPYRASFFPSLDGALWEKETQFFHCDDDAHAGFWEEAAMPNFAEQIFSFLLQTEKLA